MTTWIGSGIVVALAAYLCGSIPTGYWLGRLLKGIDIREHGSRSTGATNVLRTLGKGPAAVALLVDLLKGIVAVLFAGWVFTLPAVVSAAPTPAIAQEIRSWALAAAALLAVIGHSRSVWIRFTGGKSAATGLGVLLALSWPVGLGVAAVFGLVLAVFRMVSLGSIAAAVAAVVLMAATHQPTPFLALAIVGAAYVVARHRANIGRLWAGTEPRIGRPLAGPGG